MAVSVNIRADAITVDTLVDVYHLFCDAFEMERNDHQDALLGSQYSHLVTFTGIDFRPYMGAKFFAKGFGDGQTEFYGYSEPNDSRQDEKIDRFSQLLEDYFS